MDAVGGWERVPPCTEKYKFNKKIRNVLRIMSPMRVSSTCWVFYTGAQAPCVPSAKADKVPSLQPLWHLDLSAHHPQDPLPLCPATTELPPAVAPGPFSALFPTRFILDDSALYLSDKCEVESLDLRRGGQAGVGH